MERDVESLGFSVLGYDPTGDASHEADRFEAQMFILFRSYSDVCFTFNADGRIVTDDLPP
jgi:hypothetical protein